MATAGRPNVGKSTVVNRLARQFSAGSIVYDEPGVTRDRTYKRAWYCGKDYDIVDTGGLVFDDKGGDVFAKEVWYGANGPGVVSRLCSPPPRVCASRFSTTGRLGRERGGVAVVSRRGTV